MPSYDYYNDKLSAGRLRRVYEIATLRLRQYLDAEVAFVLEHVQPGDAVLELGCGYGRIIPALAEKADKVVGIDTSEASLEMARELLRDIPNCEIVRMDAVALEFVCRPGGIVLFSSYSDRFWEHRLEWFELQAGEGLLGEIDYAKTGDGVIVCKDGFTATTVSAEEFRVLATGFDGEVQIADVDESSLFCVIKPEP